MKSFLAGLGIALAVAMVWQKRAKSRPQPRHAPAGERKKEQRGGMGMAPQRTRPETRAEEPVPSASADTPAGRSAAMGGGAADLLNSATRQQLLSVYGIGPVLADRIIQNRPYKSAYEVVEKGIIPESIFAQLRKQLLQQGA